MKKHIKVWCPNCGQIWISKEQYFQCPFCGSAPEEDPKTGDVILAQTVRNPLVGQNDHEKG
jgi:Zn finger protein HypA/HybF involved in hydrogenase expression